MESVPLDPSDAKAPVTGTFVSGATFAFTSELLCGEWTTSEQNPFSSHLTNFRWPEYMRIVKTNIALTEATDKQEAAQVHLVDTPL